MADVMARNDHLELRLIGDPEQSPDTTSNTGLWDSGVVSQGEAFGRIFRKAGTFKYHCRVHPSALRAIITVT
jgi:plastocyanin